MIEQLGIIHDINIGMRDLHNPACWFMVETLQGDSLQIVSIEEMTKMVSKGNVYKLSDLNGKACVVNVDDGICKYLRLK